MKGFLSNRDYTLTYSKGVRLSNPVGRSGVLVVVGFRLRHTPRVRGMIEGLVAPTLILPVYRGRRR